MEAHLKTNVLLGEHAQSVKFHWCGPRSDAGIMMLHNLRNLNELTVVVSKLTTVHPTRRDAIYARYFGGRPSSSARMTDALGMDELLTLRRLRIVSTEHISRRPGDRISESVRYQLHVLLREKLERPPVNGIPLGFYTWTVPTKP